jgi:ABC-type lipoprotein export system ATPase subunit
MARTPYRIGFPVLQPDSGADSVRERGIAPPAYRFEKTERRHHVEAALKVVGLADRMDHYPRQLSGGQEQRVAIARAIVTDPTIIVADEPTGDLDARSAEEILNLMRDLNREFHKTIVMVTHDQRAERFVETVYHLDKGILAGVEAGRRVPAQAAAASAAHGA